MMMLAPMCSHSVTMLRKSFTLNVTSVGMSRWCWYPTNRLRVSIASDVCKLWALRATQYRKGRELNGRTQAVVFVDVWRSRNLYARLLTFVWVVEALQLARTVHACHRRPVVWIGNNRDLVKAALK